MVFFQFKSIYIKLGPATSRLPSNCHQWLLLLLHASKWFVCCQSLSLSRCVLLSSGLWSRNCTTILLRTVGRNSLCTDYPGLGPWEWWQFTLVRFCIILGGEFHSIKVFCWGCEWVSKGGDWIVEPVDGQLVLVARSDLHQRWQQCERKSCKERYYSY